MSGKSAKSKTAKRKTAKKPGKAAPNPILTPDAANQVLKAEIARIVQKAKDKQPLTSTEFKHLERMGLADEADDNSPDESSPDFVTSVAALCGVLGIDRKTYYNWKRKHERDVPQNRTNGSYDVLAWKEFIKRKGLKSGFDATDDEEDGEDLDSLKIRDLRAKAMEREFKLEILRKEYLHKDDVRESITLMVAEAIKLVRDKLENELPPVCAGLDALEIRLENARVVDEFCAMLHGGITE